MKIVALGIPLLSAKEFDLLRKDHTLITIETVPHNSKELIQLLIDAECVVTKYTPISKEIISSLSHLKYICVAATGYNVVDMESARQKGIVVSNCPDYATEATAELAVGLILDALRHITHSYQTLSKNAVSNNFIGTELRGKLLGIIGFGRIGKRVADITKQGFGMRIMYTTSSSTQTEFETLLKTSDIICITAPLTNKTRNLIDQKAFAMMRSGVVLINIGRGGIINEPALMSSLQSGHVAAAGLDVVVDEPIAANNPLLSFPQVVITPHMGASTHEAIMYLTGQVFENILAFTRGTPQNMVS